MRKAIIVNLDNNCWGVKVEDGQMVSVLNDSNQIVPMEWDKKFNSKEDITIKVESTSDIKIVESFNIPKKIEEVNYNIDIQDQKELNDFTYEEFEALSELEELISRLSDLK